MTETRGPWLDIARRLTDTRRCPDCGADLDRPMCSTCGLDLGVERAHEVRQVSFDAAELLLRRAELISGMRAEQRAASEAPAGPRPASTTAGQASRARADDVRSDDAGADDARTDDARAADRAGAATAPAGPPAGGRAPGTRSAPSSDGTRPASPRPARRTPGPRADVSMQPILAGAGALLLAVAAVVFVFFTFGDNLALRAVVTGIVTVAAATVAALLRRGGLRTTSEAVAALAAVLCWVDVELAMQAGFLAALDPALARAVVLAGLAPTFVAVGHRLKVRSWVSAGLAAAIAVPFSAAAGTPDTPWTPWWWTLAFVVVAALAHAERLVLPRLAGRLGDHGVPFTAERRALEIIRAAAPPAALLMALLSFATPGLATWGGTAILWSAVVAAALTAGYLLRVRPWVTAGALALPVVPVVVTASLLDPGWAAWWWSLTCVAVAAAAHATRVALSVAVRRPGRPLGPPFEQESRLLRLLRGAGFPVALWVSLFATESDLPGDWWTTAVLWAVVALTALTGGVLLRVRSWVSTAALALPAVPLLTVSGIPAPEWGAARWVLALVLVAFVALGSMRGLPRAARRLGDRLGRPFTAETAALRVARAAALPLALGLSLLGDESLDLPRATANAVLWSAVVAVALLGGTTLRVRAWATAGLLAAPAIPVLTAGALEARGWDAALWTGALVVTAAAAWGAMRLMRPLARRLRLDPGAFGAERTVLDVVRTAGLPLALTAALVVSTIQEPPPPVLPGTTVMSWVTALWTAVLVAGAVAGHTLRVRAWTSTAVLAAPLLPLVALTALPLNAGESWLPSVAFLVAALTTLLARAAVVVSGTRLGTGFAPERVVSDVVAALALVLAVALAIDVTQPEPLPGHGGTAVLLVLAAATAAMLRRVTHRRHLLAAGGVLLVAAGGFLGFTEADDAIGWVPFAAACAWALLAVGTAPRLLAGARLGSVHGALAGRTRSDLLLSGWAVAATATVPAAILVVVRVADLWGAAATASRGGWLLPAGPVAGPFLLDDGVAAAAPAGWSVLGVTACALATLLAARLVPDGGDTRPERLAAPFLVLAAVTGGILHPAWPVAVSLVALAVLGVVLVAATADRRAARPRLRPVVDGVQGAWAALVRAAHGLWAIGGRPVSDAEQHLARRAALAGGIGVTVLLAAYSWVSRPTAAVGALVVCGLVLALRAALPRAAHPWLVGVAYVYPLVALGVVLGWLDLSLVAAICTVSAVASLVTIAVTLGGRSSRAEWYVVLGVTATPFLAGVVTVAFERSWWSAGAAAAMLCLELVLLLTARRGLPELVRAGAAFLLLPTAGVMITSAGGEIAEIFRLHGSPFVLPVAATCVAVVAAGAARVAERIAARLPDASAGLPDTIRGMLERSAALTGAITIGLAYAREAAGPDVAVAVLLIHAAGSALVAREPGRRKVWVLTGALLLAALWTALGSNGVRLVEAYTFPPAVGAVALGLFVAWRRSRAVSDDGREPGTPATGRRSGQSGPRDASSSIRNALAVAGAGAVLGVLPSILVYLTRPGPGDWRAYALVGMAGAALAAGFAVGRLRGRRRVWGRSVRRGLAALAALTAPIGVLESWRVAPAPGLWPGDRGVRDRASAGEYTAGRVEEPFTGIPAAPAGEFVVGLSWAAAAVVALVLCVLVARPVAGRRLTGLLRGHGFVPALTLGTVSLLAHMEPAWGAVVTLLVVELALLTAMVLGVRRMVAGRAMGAAPWFVWVCAALVGIAAWAPRELRVETFSAPLGVALILAGWVALRDRLLRDRAAVSSGAASGTAVSGGTTADTGPGDGPVPRLGRWPVGFPGSWRTLALGVLALVGPSVLSTATDPLTVRASGVVFVALMAVLAGSRLRLSAPFWLGVVTLGVEVLVVFAKLGVGVSPLPWILTLVPAALVLLIIATLDERRTAASGGTAAYLRDLR